MSKHKHKEQASKRERRIQDKKHRGEDVPQASTSWLRYRMVMGDEEAREMLRQRGIEYD